MNFIKRYMVRLGQYLEETVFCKDDSSWDKVIVAIAKKGVYSYRDCDMDFSTKEPGVVLADGHSGVVIPNVKGFDIVVAENAIVARNILSKEIVLCPNI